MKRTATAIVVLGIILAGCGMSARNAPYSGRVVVYSPHGPEVLADYEDKFEKAYPGVNVEWLYLGSQEVYNRVKGEQRRPQGDVWWGAPSTMFIQAAEEGLLEAYTPEWADAVPVSYRDAEGRWYGVHASPLAVMYNNRHYSRDDVPQTWDALLEPQWANKVAIRKPLPSGTMRTFIGAMVLRAPSVDAGFAWLKRFDAQVEAYLESPQFLYDHVKRREEIVSVWIMPDIVLQRDRHGYPFGFVVPPETPVIAEGIALIKGGPNAEWARRFFDFVTTEEALAQQAHAYAKKPTREDIDPATLPEWMRDIVIEPLGIDWRTFAENEDAWMDRWQRETADE